MKTNKIANSIFNHDRLKLIQRFSDDNFEAKMEESLEETISKGSDSLKSMIKLFTLIDNSSNTQTEDLKSYLIGNRKIEIINTSKQLLNAMNSIEHTPFLGFDTEQKPTFKKGESSHGVSIVQLATKTKCYLIQTKQIRNLKPLINLLENEKVIKVGTGLRGDNDVLFKQFNLRLKSTIDLENVFKKLSSKNQIGSKRAALIILNEKLQKSKNMSRSNWENKKLTDGQIKYASEDATVVYDVMKKIIEDYPFTLGVMPEFFQSQYK